MLDDFVSKKRTEPSYTPRGLGDTPMDSEVKPETTDSLPLATAPPEEKKEDLPTIPADKTKKPRKPINKKKVLIISAIVLVLASGGFAGWWFGFRDSGSPKVENTKTTDEEVVEEEAEDDGLVESPLSGERVSEADSKRPVTAIMIENSGEARPQSGLREADVVFEAIAEGGITRFLALYQAKQPTYIGPVRSARPYYVEWAKAFDASYIHAGGSPDGMARISQLGVKDISAFGPADTFFRTSDRFAPHNLYTTFAGIDKINTDNGFTTSTFTPWKRKNNVPQTAVANKIDIGISSSFYNVHYDYDAATNTYPRTMGGEAHKDERSGATLAPSTVLVMVMGRNQSGIYSVYSTTGTGTFTAFQDGVVSTGTWSRPDFSDNYTFKDKYGFDFNFNRGQVWVSVVTAPEDVISAP